MHGTLDLARELGVGGMVGEQSRPPVPIDLIGSEAQEDSLACTRSNARLTLAPDQGRGVVSEVAGSVHHGDPALLHDLA